MDHVDKYKAPKQFDENNLDENGDPKLIPYQASGAEGQGYQAPGGVFFSLTRTKQVVNAGFMEVLKDRPWQPQVSHGFTSRHRCTTSWRARRRSWHRWMRGRSTSRIGKPRRRRRTRTKPGPGPLRRISRISKRMRRRGRGLLGKAELPSHQLTWKCTDPCRKTTFLLERAFLHFHVGWSESAWFNQLVLHLFG